MRVRRFRVPVVFLRSPRILHNVLKKTKVLDAVFASWCASTRPQGPEPRTHRRGRRYEATDPRRVCLASPTGCMGFGVETDQDVVRAF
jgi:hypothetical protein